MWIVLNLFMFYTFHTDNMCNVHCTCWFYTYIYITKGRLITCSMLINSQSILIKCDAMVCSHVQCLCIRCSMWLFVNESSIIFERFDSIKSRDVLCSFLLLVLQCSLRLKDNNNSNNIHIVIFVFCLLLSSGYRSIRVNTYQTRLGELLYLVFLTIDKRID